MSFYRKLRASFIVALLFGGSLMATELVIDESHSEVGFSVKHLMISNVNGKFKEFGGDIDFDLKSKKIKKFDGVMMVKSIDTGIGKRDEHLRSVDFFDESKFPKITYKMLKYTSSGNEGVMDGILTIRGISKPIKLNVEIGGIIKDQKGETKVGFSLNGKINRKDFGLNWNKVLEAGGVAVGDEVKLKIELETSVL